VCAGSAKSDIALRPNAKAKDILLFLTDGAKNPAANPTQAGRSKSSCKGHLDDMIDGDDSDDESEL